MKVLVFGSLNIDYVYSVNHFVQPGETLLADDRQIFSGGKGLNQSVALARAGAEVYHAGAVGNCFCKIWSGNVACRRCWGGGFCSAAGNAERCWCSHGSCSEKRRIIGTHDHSEYTGR